MRQPLLNSRTGPTSSSCSWTTWATGEPSRCALVTGRFSIRSGTYEVPIGGVPGGLTTWEDTIAQLLAQQGYATGMWGKWHLGSIERRLPI